MGARRSFSFAVPWAVLALGALAQAAHKIEPRYPQRPPYEDIFGEKELRLGFKLGPVINGYTSINAGRATVDVQSSMRGGFGLALQFVYGFPCVEADLFWNVRAGVNTAESIHSLVAPVLVKLPWRVASEVDIELGAGYQPDFALFGRPPHRNFMQSILGSVGIVVDLGDRVFAFETRYAHGLESVDAAFNGARPRDLQMLGGLLWRL